MRLSRQMLLKIFSYRILVLFLVKIIILHAQFYIRKKENWTYPNQYIRFVNNSHSIWIYSILTMDCCFYRSPLWLKLHLIYRFSEFQPLENIFSNITLRFWLFRSQNSYLDVCLSKSIRLLVYFSQG